MNQYLDASRMMYSALELASHAWNRFVWTRRATRGGIDDLLRSDVTARADIEFTTRCNLACVYCVSRLPSYSGSDLDSAYLEGIVQSLKPRGVLTIGVSGHGETTMMRDWHLHCNELLDNQFDLYLSTNLSRELSDEEVDTLSRFQLIQVSTDTSDAGLFKELRRGGDFRTLLYNMNRIRGRAVRSRARVPVFWWHCVVSDRTVWKLEEHVGVGLSAGVKLFNFINLAKHPDMECDEVNLITDMPRDQLERLPEHFHRVFDLIRSNGGDYICDSLLERLEEKLSDPISPEPRNIERHFSLQQPGTTRDCIDPWSYAKVMSSGAVVPCCRTTCSVGLLSDGRQLHELLNDAPMREFRRSLLTGALHKDCLTCNIRRWTSIDKLRFKVAMFLRFNKYLRLFHRSGLLLPLVQKLRHRPL